MGFEDFDDQADDLARKIPDRYESYGVIFKFKENDTTICNGRIKYKVKLRPGTRVDEIEKFAKDVRISLKLSQLDVLEEDNCIFIVVAKKITQNFSLLKILKNKQYLDISKRWELPYIAGLDVMGKLVIKDLLSTNHILIGGASGTGKTVALEMLILCLVSSKSAARVNLLLIDVGANCLMQFDGLDHLSCPPIRDPEKGVIALSALAREMERRRELEIKNPLEFRLLPRIVCIIDEFPALISGIADKQTLKQLTAAISSLLRRGRHANICIVLAAQNPTAQNMKIDLGPITARMAFRVPRKNFSETILGESGAERLRRKGDMLLKTDELQYIQGSFITKDELERALFDIRRQRYSASCEERKFVIPEADLRQIGTERNDEPTGKPVLAKRDVDDKLFAEIVFWVLGREQISCNSISENFHIGWNRADTFLKRLHNLNITGDLYAKLPRVVLPVCFEDLPKEIVTLLKRFGYTSERVEKLLSTKGNRPGEGGHTVEDMKAVLDGKYDDTRRPMANEEPAKLNSEVVRHDIEQEGIGIVNPKSKLNFIRGLQKYILKNGDKSGMSASSRLKKANRQKRHGKKSHSRNTD